MVKIGAHKIPEMRTKYARLKDQVEVIDYKKTMAKHELENMNNLITILNSDIYNKTNKIAYFNFVIQALEGHIHRIVNIDYLQFNCSFLPKLTLILLVSLNYLFQ